MEKTRINPVRLMILVFVLLCAFFMAGKTMLAGAGVDYLVALGGNIILFLVGILSVARGMRAIENTDPQVFVRVYFSGFLIKLLVCAAAVVAYFYLVNGAINKNALFVCLVVYILYTIIEVFSLKRLLKEKNNA